MKSIQVFDPALCCSSGVCGVDVDQALVSFAADVEWARQQGVQIERFNLAQQPMAFAENATVKGFLENAGQEALPLTLADGALVLAGRYPTRADLARWTGVALPSTGQQTGGCGCSSSGDVQSQEPAGCCGSAEQSTTEVECCDSAKSQAQTQGGCCGSAEQSKAEAGCCGSAKSQPEVQKGCGCGCSCA